jgi:hypothetical protein
LFNIPNLLFGDHIIVTSIIMKNDMEYCYEGGLNILKWVWHLNMRTRYGARNASIV